MKDRKKEKRHAALLAGLLLAMLLPGVTLARTNAAVLQIDSGSGPLVAGHDSSATGSRARAHKEGVGDVPPPPDAPSVPYTGDYEVPDRPAAGSRGQAWQSRSLDLNHSSAGASVHVVDQRQSPDPGAQRFYLWVMTENLVITADDVPLDYILTENPDAPELIVDVDLPPATDRLTLEYDRADGALAFEGFWYLAYDTVWGPTTITIHLPDDAVVERYDGEPYATWLDPHTLELKIPDGTGFSPFVVYETVSVPELYETVVTPHFEIHLPSVYEPYNDAVVSMLENAYNLFNEYSDQDLNQLAGQDRYEYYYPPGGWYWWGSTIPLGGGLTVAGGPSAVRSSYVPYSTLPHTVYLHLLAAMSFHELANGWWLLLHEEPWLQPTLPWWINSEGHSGFLRSQAELDLGYCTDAQREHDSHYARYLQCKAAEPPGNRCGELVEIMLISLRDRYGWSLLQSIYAGVQDGSLDMSGLSDQEKDDRMVLFLSQQVGENLVSFFDDHGIFTSAYVREELSGLPVAEVPIVSTLECPEPLLHYTPPELVFRGKAGQPDPAARAVYVGAPVSWTATVSPTVAWLSMSRDASSNFATLKLSADGSDLPAGSYDTSVVLTTESPLGNSPAVIPVRLLNGPFRWFLPLVLKQAPPHTYGWLKGTVASLGACDQNPAPLAEAEVTVEGSTGVTWTLTTDDAGAYSLSLSEVHSPLAVTFSHPEHETAQASGVVVSREVTTTLDASLRWLRPCLHASPAEMGARLDPGRMVIQTLTLSNSGAAPAEFALGEFRVLLVDDDELGWYDALPYYVEALQHLGGAYDLCTTNLGSGPSAAQMAQYPAVVWFSGDVLTWVPYGDPWAGPNSDDEIELAKYLDGGGRLFLTSMNYGLDMGLTDFMQTYLGMADWAVAMHPPVSGLAGAPGGDDISITGVPGDPIGGGFGTLSLSPPGYCWPAQVIPDATASGAFRSDAGGFVALDKREYGYCTAYFGFPWEALQNHNPADGEAVLAAILTWFGVDVDVAWLRAEPATGTVPAGGTLAVDVVFDASVPEAADPGEYEAALFVQSNDPRTPVFEVRVMLTVGTFGLPLEPPVSAMPGYPGETVTYRLHLTNNATVAETFDVAVSHNAWPASAPSTLGPIDAGRGTAFVVAVTIPQGVAPGTEDTAWVRVTSRADPARSATAYLTTWAIAGTGSVPSDGNGIDRP